ncbi:MAG: TetM/TetW/TetO/TetS family tetracycline resistance ribosomal protection protein [Proteiniphilum sp.]|jgi:ribosomal protection tetracycline resistance protein|uniref:TetM/TetW/TetO/TetS family tetracycline resistance ribosomal protection protein n=1 Tax=Proteiniphilum sp. TaxID=1926877 RepID=UPI002B1F78D1|nr:TetM/TetW/TetO/TetS family tetracycline resistance ribosomal protection protein [Proteiniphilum sp.]MEA5130203.1 TetM/TetW/TetO/TetS family tetracycline resistance ribosomal protection protein [Proteiniphilum sp.]
MKTVNIGILAHVDAGKTTLTESLLYTSGAIAELGSVDKGTTRTDSMLLEKQRGITIQASVTSFQWGDTKINLVDTPGHMDFLAEVYRSLSVLDGAVLVISAKDGVQAQTRILFHALQSMKIPTLLFINKIDQSGVDLQKVYRDIKDKLSTEILIKQRVELFPDLSVTDQMDLEQWDIIIAGDDELLEKYTLGEQLDIAALKRIEKQRFQECTLFPLYHGSAKKNIGTPSLIDAISNVDSTTGNHDAELCGNVFKVEYLKKGCRMVYLRLYGGTLHTKDTVMVAAGDEKIKINEIRVPSKGEICCVDVASSGEIVILPGTPLKLNDVIGNAELMPRKIWSDFSRPMMRATIHPVKETERELLLEALTEIADVDPLLRYDVDSMTHEITLSFLGKVQMEIVCALLAEKYNIAAALGNPTVIFMERPLAKSVYTIHIAVPPNPFWASIGLSIEPLPLGSGIRYESRVSVGYLNQSFQNAVADGIRYGCEQGLYGWEITDCKICFEYGLYFSPVSTPADFRSLAPIVLEQALRKSGTELLEPYLSFTVYAPQEYMSRSYNDVKKYEATVGSTDIKGSEVILSGEIPARYIQEYREELAFCTNGLGVCLTELKGYQVSTSSPAYQARRPNPKLDKTRYLFNKLDT